MGTKLKRVLTLFAVSTLCTNLLAFTKPVKALADEGINKTIVVIKDRLDRLV